MPIRCRECQATGLAHDEHLTPQEIAELRRIMDHEEWKMMRASTSAPGVDWMQIVIELPTADGIGMLAHLRQCTGFTEVDWCELRRPDQARATYTPCDPHPPAGAQ